MLADIEMVDKFMEFRQHYYLLNESELQLIIGGQPNTKERLGLAKKIDNFEK